MNDAQYNVILEEIRKANNLAKEAKAATDDLNEKWESDRLDFSNFSVALKKLEDEFKELRNLIISLPKETRDRVRDAMKPIQKETQGLIEALEEQPVLVNDIQEIKEKKKPWWKRIFKRKGGD